VNGKKRGWRKLAKGLRRLWAPAEDEIVVDDEEFELLFELNDDEDDHEEDSALAQAAQGPLDDQFVPRLERHFNTQGFFFERSAERARFGSRDYVSCYAEIDVFLENCHRALAVAVARSAADEAGTPREADSARFARADFADIRDHLEQMERLRRHFDLNNDRRELYGAVAAAGFSAPALDYALDRGLYVVICAEEQVEVKRPGGGAKVW
jgi:hypothetical protein